MIKINVAGCRIPVSRNIKENIKEIKISIDRFAVAGVDIAVTPECALSGYLWKPSGLDDPRIEEIKNACDEIAEYSKKKKVDLVLGTARLNKINQWCNSQIFIVDGKPSHVHDKAVLFHEETALYAQGDEIQTFMYKGLKTAGLICNDAWANPFVFPETSTKILSHLASEKVDVVFISANVPTDIYPKKLFYDWHKTWLSMAAASLKMNIVVSDVVDPVYGPQAVCPVGIISANSVWEVLGDDRSRSYFSHNIIANTFDPNRY